MSALPPPLRSAIQQLLEGRSRRELATRAQAASIGYRGGGNSSALIRDEADVAAYLVSRMPATFAAVAAAIDAIKTVVPDFAPRSLLDVACGPGTASFAGAHAWPSLAQMTLVDANAAFLAAARQLAPAGARIGSVDLRQVRVDATMTDLLDTDLPEADFVVMAYALVEMPIDDATAIVQRLWARCSGILLLVEPGSREGFERLRRCRDMLTELGAHVVAPCTHEAACPMMAPDWCHFSRRLPRLRDHMITKAASVPFEDEKYAYVAFAHRTSSQRRAARVLAPPKASKARWIASVCSNGSIVALDVPRGDPRYRGLKKVAWGDALDRSVIAPDDA